MSSQLIDIQRDVLRAESNYRSKHIAALRRRLEWLEKRITEEPLNSAMSHFKAERGALRWVLDEIGA